jgi:hypothetical protein
VCLFAGTDQVGLPTVSFRGAHIQVLDLTVVLIELGDAFSGPGFEQMRPSKSSTSDRTNAERYRSNVEAEPPC